MQKTILLPYWYLNLTLVSGTDTYQNLVSVLDDCKHINFWHHILNVQPETSIWKKNLLSLFIFLSGFFCYLMTDFSWHCLKILRQVYILSVKGQLISKCLWCHRFDQKTNVFFLRISALASKKRSKKKIKALYYTN